MPENNTWIADLLLSVAGEAERQGLLAVSAKVAEASILASIEAPNSISPEVARRIQEINERVIPFSELEMRQKQISGRRNH